MLLETIRHYLAIWMYAGFASEQEIVTRAIEDWECSWEEDGRPQAKLRELIECATRELLEQHREEQKRWSEITDCDRLDAAFSELDQQGIIARQNYEQTLTSGISAIEMEAKRERASRSVIGYVFYHEQDTESAVSWNSGPVLAWGAFEGGEEADQQVARMILKVLDGHGIRADWLGDSDSRIIVTDLRWQRRRKPG